MRPVIDELDADVRALLDVAASSLEAPENARSRVSARLSASLLSVPGSTSVARGPSSSAPVGPSGAAASGLVARAATRTVVSAFIAGAVAGAGTLALLRSPPVDRIVYVERPATGTAQPPSSHGAMSAFPTTETAPSKETIAPQQVPAPHVSSRPAEPRIDNLDVERSLLDVARRALAEGKPGDALAPLAAHARRFPNGVLVEEREGLAINALVGSSRYDEARTRAAEFLRRFPGSLLRSSVEAAVAAIP